MMSVSWSCRMSRIAVHHLGVFLKEGRQHTSQPELPWSIRMTGGHTGQFSEFIFGAVRTRSISLSETVAAESPSISRSRGSRTVT